MYNCLRELHHHLSIDIPMESQPEDHCLHLVYASYHKINDQGAILKALRSKRWLHIQAGKEDTDIEGNTSKDLQRGHKGLFGNYTFVTSPSSHTTSVTELDTTFIAKAQPSILSHGLIPSVSLSWDSCQCSCTFLAVWCSVHKISTWWQLSAYTAHCIISLHSQSLLQKRVQVPAAAQLRQHRVGKYIQFSGRFWRLCGAFDCADQTAVGIRANTTRSCISTGHCT